MGPEDRGHRPGVAVLDAGVDGAVGFGDLTQALLAYRA
jgi:hypothetical protein